MKRKLFLISIALAFGLIVSMAPSATAEHMDEFPTMDCTNPTESFAVSVIVGELKFNTTTLTIPKNICFNMTFVNHQTEEHDFTIQDSDGVEWVHMDVSEDSTQNQAPGVGYHYYMSPDEDVTLTAYCEVEGHREGGMEFDVIIGDGTQEAPGFGFPLAIVGFLAMIAILPKRRN